MALKIKEDAQQKFDTCVVSLSDSQQAERIMESVQLRVGRLLGLFSTPNSQEFLFQQIFLRTLREHPNESLSVHKVGNYSWVACEPNIVSDIYGEKMAMELVLVLGHLSVQ